jgi:hypothetical protein
VIVAVGGGGDGEEAAVDGDADGEGAGAAVDGDAGREAGKVADRLVAGALATDGGFGGASVAEHPPRIPILAAISIAAGTRASKSRSFISGY